MHELSATFTAQAAITITMAPTHIPDELLILILSYGDITAVRNMSLASHRFREVARPFLYRKICFLCDGCVNHPGAMGMAVKAFFKMIELHPEYAKYVEAIETPCDLSGNLARIVSLLPSLKSFRFVPVRCPLAADCFASTLRHLLAALGVAVLTPEDGPFYSYHGAFTSDLSFRITSTIIRENPLQPLPLKEVYLLDGACDPSQAINRHAARNVSVRYWTAAVYYMAQFPNIRRITLDYDYTHWIVRSHGFLLSAAQDINDLFLFEKGRWVLKELVMYTCLLKWSFLRRFAVEHFLIITSLESIVLTYLDEDWSCLGEVEQSDTELQVIRDGNVVTLKRKAAEDEENGEHHWLENGLTR